MEFVISTSSKNIIIVRISKLECRSKKPPLLSDSASGGSSRRDANSIKDAVIRGNCHTEITKMSKKVLSMKKELGIDENSFTDGTSENEKINSCKNIIAKDYEKIHKRLMLENLNQKVQDAANEKYANNMLSGAQNNLKAVDNMINRNQQEDIERFESRYSY